MKAVNARKVPFGTGKFSRLRSIAFHQWDDTFEVEFEDGQSFSEPHKNIREANRIAFNAKVEKVQLDEELRHGFFVYYSDGTVAEVSWAFIREFPPTKK